MIQEFVVKVSEVENVSLENKKAVAETLFDVAWLKQEGEEVYQEDRFGVPCEVLRYESVYPSDVDFETEDLTDPNVPF